MKFFILTIIICISAECIAIETIPNNVIFEKVTYKVYNQTLLTNGIIKWKKVAYNVVQGCANLTITEPLNEIWVRLELYYKYRVYQKHLIDSWFEVCAMFKDPAKNPLTDKLFEYLYSVIDDIYMDFDFHCPLFGNFSIQTKPGRAINMSTVKVPLMEAGRYRIDVTNSRHQNGPVLSLIQIFVSISDFRVWF